MSLKARITDDMKAAMRAGEKERLGAIRLILAALKQREVDERIVLDDAQLLAILEKMLKQRRDSIEQYSIANREDLAAVERAEVAVIQAYMPTPLSSEELDRIVAKAIADSGATSVREMGKVVGLVKPLVAGRADMGCVSELIKARLA